MPIACKPEHKSETAIYSPLNSRGHEIQDNRISDGLRCRASSGLHKPVAQVQQVGAHQLVPQQVRAARQQAPTVAPFPEGQRSMVRVAPPVPTPVLQKVREPPETRWVRLTRLAILTPVFWPRVMLLEPTAAPAEQTAPSNPARLNKRKSPPPCGPFFGYSRS